MSIGRWQKDLLAQASNYCDNVSVNLDGRHIKIVMTGPDGRSRYVVCSSTPGDWRVLHNTAKKMKQVAAEVGSYR